MTKTVKQSLRSVLLAVAVLIGCSSPEPPDPLLSAPHVVNVETTGSEAPAKRVIHILDWHVVSREAFAADLELSGEELDRQYAQHLTEVEAVQREQMELLEHMLQHDGLEAVYLEGLSDESLSAFHAACERLKNEEEPIAAINRQIKQIETMITELEQGGHSETEQYLKAVAIKADLRTMIEEHQASLLQLGAAGRLYMLGKLKAVLPAESLDAHAQANPLANGAVQLDLAKQEAREHAIVQELGKASDKTVVLVLGGDHDLSDNIPADWSYVRVAVSEYGKINPKRPSLDDGPHVPAAKG